MQGLMNAKYPIKAPQDFTIECGCQVRFDNDGYVRLAQCPMHTMAADLHDVLKTIVDKSYLRPGKHEDCHVHPELIEAGRRVLDAIKLTSPLAVPAEKGAQ
jgi:hypothetical protein